MNYCTLKSDDLNCLAKCDQLTLLSVCGVAVSDPQLKIIAGLKQLTVLEFNGAKFSNEQLEKTVHELPMLHSLTAMNCNIKKETIARLLKDPRTGKTRNIGIITGKEMEGLPEYAKASFDMMLDSPEVITAQPTERSGRHRYQAISCLSNRQLLSQ